MTTRTPATRESLRRILGVAPTQAPLGVQILETQYLDGYTRQLVEFTVVEGERIHAFVLTPENVPFPVPGILAIHQDGNSRPYAYGKSEVAGLAGDSELGYGLELCRRGYVVICPDRFPVESRNLANSPYQKLFEGFRLFVRMDTVEVELTEDMYRGCVNNQLLADGWTPLGKDIYELQRALDVLVGLPQENTTKIGVVGHSAGGTLAAYLMFLDPRVGVGCVSCGSWLASWSTGKGRLRPIGGFAGITPGLGLWGDMDDVLAGIAPRPYFEVRGDASEPFVLEELIGKATERYRDLNSSGRFRFETYEGNHEFRKDMRESAYSWFGWWFGAFETNA